MKIDMLMVYPLPTTDSPALLTPLSILFPGAMFEQAGLQVEYFDERFDSPDLLVDLIKNSAEIGVSAFTGYQTGRAADILIKAKEINPGIITGVGGHHAIILPDQVLAEPFVDKVWPERAYGEELFPYNEKTKIHFKRTEMQYFTSRGCPHACSFCALKSPWEPKNIDAVDRELKIMHNDLGFAEISFSDPNIAFSAREAERVSRIKQIGHIMRDISVKWDGNLRSTYLTPAMVDALVASNCFSVEIGCESGNDYFLRNVIKKGHGVAEIREAAKNIRGSGISVMYSFIANMPGETHEMLLDTLDLIDWVIATDPDARVSIYNYAPYPGNKMYEDAVAGINGYPKFVPPTTMKGWSELKLMKSPLYWIAGLNFRRDNSKKNFPGDEWKLIEPYIELAEEKWQSRDINDFPCQEVEDLITIQLNKNKNEC